MARLKNWKMSLLSLAAGVLVPVSIYAANATLPHTFSAGTPIRAEEVNANFVALRDVVNTKADAANQGQAAVTSGQRLKFAGFASPDGLRLPLHVDERQLLIYDTNLSMYCEPDLVKTSSTVQEILCVPVLYSVLLESNGGFEYYFADAACTQPLYREDAVPPVGMPAGQKFLSTEDASGVLHLYQATDGRVRTPYVGDETGLGCSSSTISRVFYSRGDEVPLSSLARMAAGIL